MRSAILRIWISDYEDIPKSNPSQTLIPCVTVSPRQRARQPPHQAEVWQNQTSHGVALLPSVSATDRVCLVDHNTIRLPWTCQQLLECSALICSHLFLQHLTSGFRSFGPYNLSYVIN